MRAWMIGMCACIASPAITATAEQESPMFLTGDVFLEACSTTETAWVGFCNGYVQGVYDSLSESDEGLCVPPGTTRAEIVGVVVQQLTNTSDLQSLRAAALVHATLSKSYPCS